MYEYPSNCSVRDVKGKDPRCISVRAATDLPYDGIHALSVYRYNRIYDPRAAGDTGSTGLLQVPVVVICIAAW